MLESRHILLCDNHLLAVNKPAGLVTQPSGRHADSLESRAMDWLKRTFEKPGNVFLEAIHRLDRPVSGVVLFARTSKALSRLNQAIREGNSVKQYLAVVTPALDPAAGHLEHWLLHASHRAIVSGPHEKGAKRAVLDYRTRRTIRGLALLEIDLLTGRYHQIRCQLSAAGAPIVGDRRYGAGTALAGDRIALHHRRLRIPHPVGGHPVILVAPLPRGDPWGRFGPFPRESG